VAERRAAPERRNARVARPPELDRRVRARRRADLPRPTLRLGAALEALCFAALGIGAGTVGLKLAQDPSPPAVALRSAPAVPVELASDHGALLELREEALSLWPGEVALSDSVAAAWLLRADPLRVRLASPTEPTATREVIAEILERVDHAGVW
jgi:hypothetical protein